jgi:hypothetical protein
MSAEDTVFNGLKFCIDRCWCNKGVRCRSTSEAKVIDLEYYNLWVSINKVDHLLKVRLQSQLTIK